MKSILNPVQQRLTAIEIECSAISATLSWEKDPAKREMLKKQLDDLHVEMEKVVSPSAH